MTKRIERKVKMVKLNSEEYFVLKNVSEEDNYIARDRDGMVRFLENYPERDMAREEWSDGWGKTSMEADDIFQFLSWQGEPYLIADLMLNYEQNPHK